MKFRQSCPKMQKAYLRRLVERKKIRLSGKASKISGVKNYFVKSIDKLENIPVQEKKS